MTTIESKTVVDYLDGYLRIADIADYGPQGLQVESERADIGRIALAVDSAPPVIAAAAAWQADMLLVHHGIFWGGPAPIRGPLGARVRSLLHANMHLYAAHLALDGHAEVGNNAVLAKMLGVSAETWWFNAKGLDIAVCGPIDTPTTAQTLAAQLEQQLNGTCRLLPHGSDVVKTVAICSGGGAAGVAEAAALGADCYITGETSHSNYWLASDYNINVIFAGHYASETVGVQALGQHLHETFGVEIQFFDFPTGM